LFNRAVTEPTILTQSPFAVLTFIAAPALLTNSSSLLVLSTINRMLRTRDLMHELFAKSEAGVLTEPEKSRLLAQTTRVENQAVLLLRALRSVYVALGSFAAATLVTLLGASLAAHQDALLFRASAGIGLLLACMGVGGLVVGCVQLFGATQLSMGNIREEAALIRERQASRG
jgi:hypothetical protein